MRTLTVLLVFGSALMIGAPALAATVISEKGEVLVNRGPGYQLVTRPTEVLPGDKVVANPGSTGWVVFPDGCTVNVEPGIVFSIARQSPCKSGGGHGETGSLKDDPKPVWR